MLELSAETKLTLSPTILLRSIPKRDSYFAFDFASGDQFNLNRTSYWILETIGTGILWQELADRFLDTYEVAREDGLRDLIEIVDQSLGGGIIRRNVDGQEGC